MSTEKVLFVEIRSAEESRQTELIALVPPPALNHLLTHHYGRTWGAWNSTTSAAMESGAMPLRDKDGYPITGDGMDMYDVYVSIGDLWRYLQKADFPLEKSPAALWVRLRPEFAGAMPDWLKRHKPANTRRRSGRIPDPKKDAAYLQGTEQIPEIVEMLRERLKKRPTKARVAAELKKRFPNTGKDVWLRNYLPNHHWD